MAATTSASGWHTVIIRVPFSSAEHADIAQRVIDVDKELQPKVVKRTLQVDGTELVATFTTLTVRLARLATNSFLENLDLVLRTLEAFAPEATFAPEPEG
ncbi:Pcc1-domain-containing protein [Calocera viscosa TUFC12733]|uniref:Pcc1-domain-containing protein n=1 Tax=Calocera viscosa (strain TUFC12733) TaxID=1330018 RepID=A0A167R5D2_CALVF|nr:Pcc1-domain-containing protein [Calocera viscosa TUFC12733]